MPQTLHFPKAKPVAQWRWKLDKDRRQVIKEETEKLIKADFIREVVYSTWLSNIVMVMKSNKK